jgi:RHS repeat-associated protein
VRGRLASITGPSLAASFSYDYQDRRSSKTVNGSTRSPREDGDDLVAEISTSGTQFTLQGPTLDEPLAQFNWYFPNGLYFTPNHLGSTTPETGLGGWVQNWYLYQPFGTTTLSNSSFTVWNHARFTGREDDGTGLYFYRARYYSPDLGRFISEDPAGLDEAGNQYAYGENDPVNYSDPFGLEDSRPGWVHKLAGGIGTGSAAVGGVVGFTVGGGSAALTGPGVVVTAPPLAVGGALIFSGFGYGLGAGTTYAAYDLSVGVGNALGDLWNWAYAKVSSRKLRPTAPGKALGKPMIHIIRYPTKKRASEGAQRGGTGKPIHHPSPANGDPPHFHPNDGTGDVLKDGTHHLYP